MSKPWPVIWGEVPVRWADAWGEPSSCSHSELQVDPTCPIPSLWFVTSRQAGCTLAKVPGKTKSLVKKATCSPLHLYRFCLKPAHPQLSPQRTKPGFSSNSSSTVKIGSNVNALAKLSSCPAPPQTDCAPLLRLAPPAMLGMTGPYGFVDF